MNENVAEEEISRENMEVSIMKCMASLMSKGNFTLSNGQLVMVNLLEVLNDVAGFASKAVLDLASTLNIPLSNAAVSETQTNLQSLPNVVRNINTVYNREQWLKKRGFFIEPEKIELGAREEVRYSTVLKSMHSVTIYEEAHYIPIEKLLSIIIEHESAKLLFPQCHPNPLPGKVKDSVDTRTFHKHALLKKYEKMFLLHLFLDAFEVTNVLGSHTSVHKLEALYMVIRNISSE